MSNIIYTLELMDLSERVDYLEDSKVYLFSLKKFRFKNINDIYYQIFTYYLINIKKTDLRILLERENNRYYVCYYKLEKYTITPLYIPGF